MRFNRVFAMPNSETFSIPPITAFVQAYLAYMTPSVDPFARDKNWATFTNDLNPETSAQSHIDAEDFLRQLGLQGVQVQLGLFDPPYSPRQISECYKSIGREVSTKETQNAALYKRVRDALDPLIVPGGRVLSFGWSSNGMGKMRGYEIEAILMIAHGGAHNDTICMAERKIGLPKTKS